MRPRAVVDLDGSRYTAAEAGIMRVHVRLGLDGTHDSATLRLWHRSKLAGSAPGTPVTISLGDEGDESLVLTGEMTGTSRRHDGVWLAALANTTQLSRTRVSRTYSEQSIADIVNDLARGADVDVDGVEADTKLSAFHVDDRRSVWSWLRELAILAGAELCAAPGGGLRFVPVRTGSADVTLRYGADLLAYELTDAPSPPVPAVAAHGAASESGAERWHWIRREPTGVGDGAVRVVAAFHNKDAADRLAEALTARASRASKRGVVLATGQPALRAGDLVELSDLPSADGGLLGATAAALGGGGGTALRARAVEHILDATAGFVTRIAVESGGAGGGLGGLL